MNAPEKTGNFSGIRPSEKAGSFSGIRPSESTDNYRIGEKVSAKGDFDTYECQTCKNRKYQDGSNDPAVSFKTPTKLSPETAAFKIRAHEAEHVSHARAEANASEDREIVSQTVTYRTGICPECGRTYMAGGNTRTVFRTTKEFNQTPVEKGRYLDVTA